MTDFPECDKFTDHRRTICRGERQNMPVDGKNSVNAYRRLWGLPPLGVTQEEWDVSKPSRGLGDVVAKITHATGIAQAAEYLFPTTTASPDGCGCKKRQQKLNEALPFN